MCVRELYNHLNKRVQKIQIWLEKRSCLRKERIFVSYFKYYYLKSSDCQKVTALKFDKLLFLNVLFKLFTKNRTSDGESLWIFGSGHCQIFRSITFWRSMFQFRFHTYSSLIHQKLFCFSQSSRFEYKIYR